MTRKIPAKLILDYRGIGLSRNLVAITKKMERGSVSNISEFEYYERDAFNRLVEQKLYLNPSVDLYNREIISFNISRRPSAAGILSALAIAIEASTDCPYRRTFHSDQGWAYQMQAYRGTLGATACFKVCLERGIAWVMHRWKTSSVVSIMKSTMAKPTITLRH